MRALQITEIERQGVHSLERFAESEAPLREMPARGNMETFLKVHGQAKTQLSGRRAGRPVHELLPPGAGLGLSRLPEPDDGDLFFDIESDPFVDGGGLEYLLGVAEAGAGGEIRYRAFWALDRVEERRGFEAFMDYLMARWKAHTGMHVYHYSPYEPAAVKRLIGRHGTREAEVDRLLRAGIFVDLLAVTRQGLRASVESYSLKELERFFGFERSVELPVASAALRRVSCALELGRTGEVSQFDRDTV